MQVLSSVLHESALIGVGDWPHFCTSLFAHSFLGKCRRRGRGLSAGPPREPYWASLRVVVACLLSHAACLRPTLDRAAALPDYFRFSVALVLCRLSL